MPRQPLAPERVSKAARSYVSQSSVAIVGRLRIGDVPTGAVMNEPDGPISLSSPPIWQRPPGSPPRRSTPHTPGTPAQKQKTTPKGGLLNSINATTALISALPHPLWTGVAYDSVGGAGGNRTMPRAQRGRLARGNHAGEAGAVGSCPERPRSRGEGKMWARSRRPGARARHPQSPCRPKSSTRSGT